MVVAIGAGGAVSSSQEFHAQRPGRRALDVLAFVVEFKTAHCGDSPSLEEIAAGVGIIAVYGAGASGGARAVWADHAHLGS